MRLTWKQKLGSILQFDEELTIDQTNELMRKGNQAVMLSDLKGTEAYRFGYLPIIKARREELVGQICNLNMKDKHEALAIRLNELDGVAKLIEDVIDEGQKAQRQLELLQESRKETA